MLFYRTCQCVHKDISPEALLYDFNSLSKESKKELEKYIQLLKLKDNQGMKK